MTLNWAWGVFAFVVCLQTTVLSAGICGNGTVRKHWSDCQKFIECGETSTIVFQCPERSFFNPDTLVCDFAMYLDCSIESEVDVGFMGVRNIMDADAGVLTTSPICNELELGAKVQHPESCNMFYHCSPSGAVLFSCPAGLLFSQKHNVCNWPQLVDCDGGNGGGGGGTLPPGLDNICPADCFPDNRCPVDCIIDLGTTLLPHPSRCDAFLQCRQGCACFMFCEEGLYWSTNLGRCVERYRSECDEIEPPECPDHKCEPHENCPLEDDPNNPIRFPHPGRCDAFKKCHEGYACTVECPEGLEYNPETEVCDVPWGCIVTTPIEPETTPSEETSEITTVEVTTPEVTTPEVTTPEVTTPEVTTPEVTTPEVTTPEVTTPEVTTPEVTTPEVTTPDATTPEITTPEITTPEITTPVVTTPEITTPEITTPVITTPVITTPVITTPVITTPEITTPEITTPVITTPVITTPVITTPVITTPEITTAVTTPEVTTPVITTPSITTEGPTCPICPPGVCKPDDRCTISCNECEPALLPHPDQCGMFLKCTHGFACEMYCPAGLHWSISANRCEWPEVAGCDGSIPTPPNDDFPNQDCPVDGRCPLFNPLEPKLLPHAYDCTKFVKCNSGKGCVMDCPEGLHWSTQHNRCEWPNRAGCDPTIPPEDDCPTCPCVPCRMRQARHPCIRHKICGQNKNESLSVPYLKDCGRFYECLNGFACLLDCPHGTHYSKKLQRCEDPRIAQCFV